MPPLLTFLLVLGVLVLAHELGHFITARLAGVKVLEFAIGFPPRILAIRRGETVYSLNILPLGGYVKMLGEEDPSDPRSLAAQPPLWRLVILSAGAAMNLVLAVALLSGTYLVPRDVPVGQVIIVDVAPGSPAEVGGLQAGDIVRSINGRPIRNLFDLQEEVNLNLGRDILVTVERPPQAVIPGQAMPPGSGRMVTVRVTPRWNPPPNQGPVGVRIQQVNTKIVSESYPIWEAIPKGVERSYRLLVLFKNEILSSIARQIWPQPVGPIGIYQLTEQAQELGPSYLLEFTALLSLNLAIINMLPIPMLDGGRVLFVLIEVARGGRRIPPEKENLAHLAGLVLLLVMIAVVSYYDLVRLISGETVGR